jgi:tripartite-type tricarboxylate transporter receptor subunit TctC
MSVISRFLAAFIFLLPGVSLAETFPSEPITLVVPYPPGGNVDTAARIIAPGLQQLLGQAVVVENRAGAAGMIAAENVKSAEPNGYRLFVAANGPLLFAPMIMGRPDAYDWKTDFTAIGSVSITPMVLSVRADLGITSVDDLIKKAAADNLLMASPGQGTTNHLAAVLMQKQANANWRIVQYKGNGPAIASLISGETAFSFDQISAILPHINEGKVIPLAVTSAKRIEELKDVPTLMESTPFKYQAVTFTGLLAPAGTPEDVVATISKALNETLRSPEVTEQFSKLGSISSPMEPAEFGAFLGDIDQTWRPIVSEVKK